MKPIRLMSGFLTVGFWTLASRVLGVLREVILLAYIGPGPVLDAFVAAFRLPNMFRRFFAEGAFNAAFVPMFSKRLEADDDPIGFCREALSGLAFVLMLFCALALLFMPALVWATASGFAGSERFDLTVEFGRVVFPYIFFISLAALFSGVLNAAGHFAAAAAAPVLLNIGVIGAMIGAALLDGPIATALVWAVPFTGAAQLWLVWRAADKAGLRIRPQRPRWTPQMKALVKVAVPAALAGGVMQINLLVGQQVASHFDKAVGWLYAADRLYQLPLGVVGIAVGIVLLPDLSRRLQAGDDTGGREALSRAAEISLALTIPAAVALVVIPLSLVSVLFERGATGAADTAAMAQAVAVYGLGLPAFVMQKVLQPLFFARGDTKSPFRFAVIAVVINAIIAFGLSPYIGWIACAWATTLAGWGMVALLILGSRGFGDVARFDARYHKRIWRIIIAAFAMGALLYCAQLVLAPVLAMSGLRYLALVALIAVGIIGYFAIAQMVGALRLSEVKGAMRRRKG